MTLDFLKSWYQVNWQTKVTISTSTIGNESEEWIMAMDESGIGACVGVSQAGG